MGADQPWTADRCTALGVSRVLDPLTCTPGDVATAVHHLPRRRPVTARGQALASQAAKLPTTAEATDLAAPGHRATLSGTRPWRPMPSVPRLARSEASWRSPEMRHSWVQLLSRTRWWNRVSPSAGRTS
jgi:hypothetical protein